MQEEEHSGQQQGVGETQTGFQEQARRSQAV